MYIPLNFLLLLQVWQRQIFFLKIKYTTTDPCVFTNVCFLFICVVYTLDLCMWLLSTNVKLFNDLMSTPFFQDLKVSFVAFIPCIQSYGQSVEQTLSCAYSCQIAWQRALGTSGESLTPIYSDYANLDCNEWYCVR